MARKNSRSSGPTRSHLAERVLGTPVEFGAARVPEKTALKPSSYVVFRAQKGKQTSRAKSREREPKPVEKPVEKPTSLASAVLKYAGKKYGRQERARGSASADERGKEHGKKVSKAAAGADDKQARLRRLLLQSNGIQAEDDESGSDRDVSQDEFVDAKDSFESPEQKDVDSDRLSEAGPDADDSEEDDADFEAGADVEDAEDAGSDADSDSGADSDSSSSSSSSSSEDIAALKRDLKEDLNVVVPSVPTPTPSKETPPTSPEDDPTLSLAKEKTPLASFYDLNELANNQGSNGSSRINKSWDNFAQGHNSLGLINHGVTCYTNSAIQALCHIPSLCHYLLDVQKGKYKSILSDQSVTKTLAQTIAKMYRIGHERKLLHINPKTLISRLDDINCMMSEWQQEDSHEYLMSLMSRLQEDSTPKGVKLNQSIIYDIFGGLLDQSVTCKSCGYISITQQEFYDLSLTLDNRRKKTSSLLIELKDLFKLKNQIENCKSNDKKSKIQLIDLLNHKISLAQDEERRKQSQSPEPQPANSNKITSSNGGTSEASSNTHSNNSITDGGDDDDHPTRTYSIENSINDFFTPEVLKTDKRDQSGYICEHCKKQTNAIKISTISRSPETLSIHLKRFRFNGQQSQKVKANVTYPEYLNLTQFTTSMDEPTMYKLTSVIVHQGRSVSSGHYIAHCRQQDGSWSTYDDEYVNKIRSNVALSDPGAYVLIYERLTHKEMQQPAAGKRRADGNASSNNDKKRKKRK